MAIIRVSLFISIMTYVTFAAWICTWTPFAHVIIPAASHAEIMGILTALLGVGPASKAMSKKD